jgi:triosephosphate isomerase
MGYRTETAPEQVQEMHEFIRETVRKSFGSDIAEDVCIYGGSVKPTMPKNLF